VLARDTRHFRIAEPSCGLGQLVKRALKIKGCATYNLKHVGSGGLLVERLAQVCRSLAELGQQPRIFDGDDGLIGEVLHQLDLFVGEQLDSDSPNRDDANDRVFPHHRYGEDGPMHLLIVAMIVSPPILGILQNIVNMDNATLQRGSAWSFDPDGLDFDLQFF